ncbi:MAG: PIG-L family deacetylase [Bacteroidales bacterium]|nr:PIG-L family deacetylase [Bacteroidales bacterium]
MTSAFKRILVLAPHTDDGELGAGGTIARFVEQNADVFYVAFSTAAESVPAHLPSDILKTEVRAATSELGIKSENLIIYDYRVRHLNYERQDILEKLIYLRSNVKPDLVLMPSLHDIHQDHNTVAQEGLRAFKTTTVLGYELIWNNLTFNTTSFVSLEQKHIEQKCKALEMYKSQAGRDYISREFIFSLAKSRGVQIGKSFAVSFEVVRWIF